MGVGVGAGILSVCFVYLHVLFPRAVLEEGGGGGGGAEANKTVDAHPWQHLSPNGIRNAEGPSRLPRSNHVLPALEN